MAVIQFENGTKVNFDGDPTPQDIEEVANSLGINKPKTPIAIPEPKKVGLKEILAEVPGAAKETAQSYASIPKNIYNAWDTARQQIGENIKGATNIMGPALSGPLFPKGFTPKQGLERNLQLFRGTTQAALGTAGPVAGAVFAPITETVKAVVPGEGLKTSIGQGALAGSAFGGVGGAIVGGIAGAGFYGLGKAQEVLVKNPKVAAFLEKNPDVMPDIQNALNIAMVVAAEQGSKKLAPNGQTDILNTPIEQVPGRIGTNLANTVKAPGKVVKSLYKSLETEIAKGKIKATEQFIEDNTKEWNKVLGKKEAGAKRLFRSNAQGKDPGRLLAEQGVQPQQFVRDGKIDQQLVENFINDNMQPKVSALGEAGSKILDAQPERGSLFDYEQQVLNSVNTPEYKALGKTYIDLQNEIRSQFDALRNVYGDDVSVGDINRIKIGQAKEYGKFDSTKPGYKTDANYLISKQGRLIVEELVDDFNIKELNKVEGSYLDAMQALRKLGPQVVGGGKLTKLIATATGFATGHTIAGKMLGAVGGNYVIDILQNNNFTAEFKARIIRNAAESNPQILTEALEYLRMQNDAMSKRLLLQAGEAISEPGPTYKSPTDEARLRAENEFRIQQQSQQNTKLLEEPKAIYSSEGKGGGATTNIGPIQGQEETLFPSNRKYTVEGINQQAISSLKNEYKSAMRAFEPGSETAIEKFRVNDYKSLLDADEALKSLIPESLKNNKAFLDTINNQSKGLYSMVDRKISFVSPPGMDRAKVKLTEADTFLDAFQKDAALQVDKVSSEAANAIRNIDVVGKSGMSLTKAYETIMDNLPKKYLDIPGVREAINRHYQTRLANRIFTPKFDEGKENKNLFLGK